MRCRFCHRFAVYTNLIQPPMCSKHYDLTVVAEHLARMNEPVTVLALQRKVREVSVTGILEEEVENLFTEGFSTRYTEKV